MKKLQLTFNKKYSTIHRIGLSQTSQVYLGFDTETQKQYAIKLQPISHADTDKGHLQRQAKIYRILKDGVGFPNLYWYGVEHEYRVLVTDVFGPTLQQLLKFCGGTFTLKTVLMIFDQIIDRIKWIHDKKFIYNDINSQNFLVGLKEKADKIFIIDFGNCKKYVDEKNKHIQLGQDKNSYQMNLRFKSIHGHLNKSLSRRDDLQSIGYMMVYFLKGSLPWDSILSSHSHQQQQQQQQQKQLLIKEQKISIPINILCENLHKQFNKYFQYVSSLQFQQQPDYTWIKRLFKDLFDKENYKWDGVMDWAEKHKH